MKNNLKKYLKYLILLIVIIIILILIIYLNTYYKATNVEKYLTNNSNIKVEKDKNGILFDGPGEDNILVFYPGAKVEYTAYSQLMNQLALEGLDTYIVKIPFNIAFFKINAIKTVKEKYKYDNWYLGGHSLGGVVAAMDTNKHNIKGLILLASYPTNKVPCNILSIYGSNDGVLQLDKYKENTSNLDNLKEIVIEGGNHAYFGSYGNQKGDIKATITRNKQIEITKNEILKFITVNN